MNKNFLLQPEDIKDLIPPMGFCLVSNMITVDGMKIGFMYREKVTEKDDSGWRFLSGTETQEYIDDPATSKIMEVNTVANYDRAIIPYLKTKYGVSLERVEGKDEFVIYEEDQI
jgi:hypothetical protein